jgi:predicted phage terminase large subunit-like protein
MTFQSLQSNRSTDFSLNDLLREKRRILRARTGLLPFTEYTFPQYEAAEHHRLICEKLEAVERGEIDRLMIFMPPRHGKSELASKRFPAWYLGRNPDRQVIAASYNSDLATDFGRQVRNIFREQRFQNAFPETSLAEDSQAANRWNTNKGGSYVAVGVGAAVTGRGAHVLLLDDLIKDREEADSENRRNLIWNWFTSTAYTRLMPGGAIVVIITRWHEDDIAGRLLEAEAKGGDKWDKLILPAIMSDGSALWPDRYDIDALNRIKRAIGPRDFSALYQQEPAPDEGTFFQRHWFERHGKIDEPHHFYLCSDYAVTDGDGDYTEHGVFAIGASGKIYQADWWHGQTSSDVWIDELLRLIKKWKPICAFGEAGVIQKAIEPMLRRRMIETGTRCRMEWLSSIHDKATRARGFQSRSAMGEVSLKDDDTGERVLNQLIAFPAGKHDDAVDVCGMIGRALDMAHPAIVPLDKPKAKTFSDYRGANTGGGDSWRI